MYKFCFVIAILLASCSGLNQHATNDFPENEVINKGGKYFSKKHSLTLDVAVSNELVRFDLYDTSNNKLAEHCDSPFASAVHRWFFILDTAGNVWFHSSDIGVSVLWKQQATHNYLRRPILNDSITRLIPNAFMLALPDSVRGYYVK